MASSAWFTVVEMTMWSMSWLRRTRSTRSSSMRWPTQGISTLPGRRAEVMRAVMLATILMR